jgi:hypothetical protein
MAATAGQGVAEHRVALLARSSLRAAPGGGASAGEATVGVAQRSAARMAADVHRPGGATGRCAVAAARHSSRSERAAGDNLRPEG